MATNIETGKLGEAIARNYLEKNGFKVLDQNWRFGRYEIDLVAVRNEKLHFIEVKTRKSKKFGFPEESVDPKKFTYLKIAAEEYLYQHPGWKRIQFDIVSIQLAKDQSPSILFIEDIYL